MVFLLMTVDKSAYSFLILLIISVFYLFHRIKDSLLKEKMLLLFLISRLILLLYDLACIHLADYLRAFLNCDYVSFIVHLSVSLFTVLSLFVYFYYLTKHWNKFRLILDISYYLFVVGYLLNAFVFSSVVQDYQHLLLTFSIFFISLNDAFLAVMIFIVVCNDRRVKSSFLSFMFISAYISTLIADVIFILDYYYQFSGQLELFGDIFLGMSLVGMVYAVDVLKEANIKRLLIEKTAKKSLGSRAIWYVLLMPIALILLDMKDFVQTSIFLIITLSYFSINRVHRQMMIRDQLLASENRVTKKAVEIVEAKAEALLTANDELYQEVHKDHLTGLKNRLFFFDYVAELMKRPDSSFSILYIDLDHFKEVNDLHGHQVGDEVLTEVSKRILYCGTTELVVSRIGGDEFVVVYPHTDRERLLDVSRCIGEQIAQPLSVRGLNFNIGSSIGIARYPLDAINVDELLNRADVAMYHAKRADCTEKISVYTRQMLEVLEEKNRIELLLSSLDVKRDLRLSFKPLYSAREGVLYACDASFYWDCAATLTCDVEQSEVFALADVELLRELMMWLIQSVVDQSVKWREIGLTDVKFIVDLPLCLLMEDEFFINLNTHIKRGNFDTNRLLLRISGRSANAIVTYKSTALNAIRKCGFDLVLDDFGGGHLSIREVKDFNVKVINICQPLIDAIDDDAIRKLVKSIILMAHSLNMSVIAKGVTNVTQLEVLRALSCDYLEVDVGEQWLTAEMFEEQCLYASTRGVL